MDKYLSSPMSNCPLEVSKQLMKTFIAVFHEDASKWPTSVLFVACQSLIVAHRPHLVEFVVEKRRDLLTYKDDLGCTLAHYAALCGSSLLNVIMEKSDLNAQDKQGSTPLHLAVRSKNSYAAQTLIVSNMCDPNVVDRHQKTALHYAVAEQDVDSVRLIISLNGDPNLRDEFGLTPLFVAAGHGSADLVKILLQSGANPSIVCKGGVSPFVAACAGHHDDVLRELCASDAFHMAKATFETIPPWAAAIVCEHYNPIRFSQKPAVKEAPAPDARGSTPTDVVAKKTVEVLTDGMVRVTIVAFGNNESAATHLALVAASQN